MKEYKEIKSKDGRTYYLNEDDTVQFIGGDSGRAYPYRYDEKYHCFTSVEGRYKYNYLRRLENEGKISWN